MSGHICPGCGTERGAAPEGGRPGCDCAARAVEAARAERAAETAAAEDFDPLRIRPYVTLPDPDEQDGAECGDARFASGTAYSEQVAPDGPGGPGAATPARSTRSTIPVRVPRRADEPPVRGQGRPVLWLSVAGVAATVAAVGTMAFAGGLFSAGPDRERDRALPITVTSAPDPGGEPSAPASASAPAAAAPRAPAASAAPSPPALPSPSRTPSADPTPSASKTLPPSSPPPSTVQATGSVEAAPEQTAVALNVGDSGPEVVELQDRLGQVWLYQGPGDGSFTADVEEAVRAYQRHMSIKDDPEGSYGPHTRRALEATTAEPDRD